MTTKRQFLSICKANNVTAEFDDSVVTILAPAGYRFMGTGSRWIDSHIIRPYPVSGCYDELIDDIDTEMIPVGELDSYDL